MICSKCQEDKTDFPKGRRKCRECYNEYMRAYYQAHPGKSSELNKVYRKRRGPNKAYQKRKEFLGTAKAKPCMDCRGRFPTECMDFDHRPGTKKLFGIATAWSVPLPRLLEEISKCDLVCANCHRIRTHQRKLSK